MRKPIAVVAAFLAMCLLVALSGYAQTTNQTTIKCAGADSMRGRIHTVARLFMTRNPNIKIEVAAGQKVDVGIQDLLDQKADVAMSSRKVSQKEREEADKKGLNLSEALIGYGGIVVVTHPSNPLSYLTLEQVKGILKGEYATWNQLGGPDLPIKVFRTEMNHPGTLIFLEEEFLGGSKITDKSIPMTYFPAILREVSKNAGAIGYVRIRDALEASRPAEEKVKIMPIRKNADAETVMPSRENILNGTYAIKRPYYLYWDTKKDGTVKKFVDFVVDKGWGPES